MPGRKLRSQLAFKFSLRAVRVPQPLRLGAQATAGALAAGLRRLSHDSMARMMLECADPEHRRRAHEPS